MKRPLDIIGKTFSQYTVISRHENSDKFLCKCECGELKLIRKNHFTTRTPPNCICAALVYENLVGITFGRLKVIDLHSLRPTRWHCKCLCGKTKNILAASLKRGHTTTCGCFINSKNVSHRMTNTRIYEIWTGIKQRCYNPKHENYSRYGGKGIFMCEEWKSYFISFYNWAKENGYKDSLTIDRIENNLGYLPSNCRWTTKLIQSQNTSKALGEVKIIEIRMLLLENKSYKEIANIYNVNFETIKNIHTNKTWGNIQL